jgi:NADH:ubiquinone oxidoreductase subunit K
MARIGFSSRRTIAYLYAWTLMLAGLALALRFIPYSDHKGHLNTGWTLVVVALALVAAAASVYLVYVLEILKFRRLDAIRLRRLRPDASPAEIELGVARDLETGEIDAVSLLERDGGPAERADRPAERADRPAERAGRPTQGDGGAAHDGPLRAEQRIRQRQVDQDRVGAEQQGGGAQTPIAADRG